MDKASLEELCREDEMERVAAVTEDASWAVGQVESIGNGPSEGQLRAAQLAEFGDLEAYACGKKSFLVDDVGLLRSTKRAELPVVVPKALVKDVLSYVHGSRLTGHYKIQRTLAKLVTRFWWKNMARDVALFIQN